MIGISPKLPDTTNPRGGANGFWLSLCFLLFAVAGATALLQAIISRDTSGVEYEGGDFLYLTEGPLMRASDLLLSGAQSDTALARTLVEDVLKKDPLNSVAVELYATIIRRSGDAPRASLLLSLANELSRHNGTAQANEGLAAILDGNPARAVEMIDLLFRDRGADVADSLVKLGFTLSEFRSAFVSKLATRPPWREAFFQRFVRAKADFGELSALVADLKAVGSELTAAERNFTLLRAVNLYEVNWAHALWRETEAGSAGQEENARPNNGAFMREVDGSPFDWAFIKQGVVRFTMPNPTGTGAADNVLRIELARARHQSALARQLVPLTGGLWRVQLSVRIDGLDARLGFGVRGRCLEDSGKILFETEGVSGETPWQDVADTFEVNPEQCSALWVELAIIGKAPTDYDTAGRIFVREIEIEAAER